MITIIYQNQMTRLIMGSYFIINENWLTHQKFQFLITKNNSLYIHQVIYNQKKNDYELE